MNFLRKIYALYCYLISAVALVMFFLFFENLFLAKTVSFPNEGKMTFLAIAADIGLLFLFGIQHSIMARDWFKKWLSNIIPAPLERVTYILISSIALALIIWLWQPFGAVIWDVSWTITGYFLWGLGLIGGVIIILSVGAINGRYFAGWQQVTENTVHIEPKFVMPSMYQYVRHPIYLGTLLLFWSVPLLSYSGLLFNIGMTAYILIGATLEERNLKITFGDAYSSYQEFVPMLIPFTKFRR